MKLLTSLILSLTLALASFQLSASTQLLKPYKGKLKAPYFELTDIEGNQHSSKDYMGQLVLLQFWATYCTPCRKEMPTMNRLIDKMKGKPFSIVTINMAESKDEVRQFISEVPVNFPVLMDSDGATLNRWKVFAAPANFILNTQGEIIYTLYGAIEWDSEEIIRELTRLTYQ